MQPLGRDAIERTAEGVGVRGYAVSSPAGAVFGDLLFTTCPVSMAREVGASLVPAAKRAGGGGALPLADLGVGALSEGGAEAALEMDLAWAEVERLEAEDRKRREDAKARSRRP